MALKTQVRKRGEAEAEAMASMPYAPTEVIFAMRTCAYPLQHR